MQTFYIKYIAVCCTNFHIIIIIVIITKDVEQCLGKMCGPQEHECSHRNLICISTT
jgi:hypothetical protein